MTTVAGNMETVSSQPARDTWETSQLPCLAGRRSYFTYAGYEIRDGAGLPITRVGRAPHLLQFQMLERAASAGPALQRIPDCEWMSLLQEAGRSFATGEDAIFYAGLVSRSSGLPRARVLKAYAALASDLGRIQEILAVQTPAGDTEFFRCLPHIARAWRPIPQGRHLAVRIPGNFPTININWLISLAARRPVLLCATLADPFTPYRLAQCLYELGIPNYSISLCYHEANVFWQSADQVLMSGDPPQALRGDRSRIHLYHNGRSKVVLADTRVSRELAERLALLAVQGCGRLCTNVSAVLTDADPDAAAVHIASAMAAFQVLPLDDPQAIVPSFPDQEAAQAIALRVHAAVGRGARDISAEITGEPLIIENDDGLFLRPTVLLASPDDPIFGQEFPFPFVVVAHVPASEFSRRCHNSLIVSVVGGSPKVVEDLIYDPTIDKVFWGDEFDRGYDPAEPHEGFLADFLFRKKVVSNYGG